MTSQKRLTKEKSELRDRADAREFKQRCIDAFVGMKTSYARLMALLNRNPDTDRYPIALDSIRRQWSELETLLYPIPDLPEITVIQAQHLQLPITGEIMNSTSQGQPSNETTTDQHEQIKQEEKTQIILSGREAIKSFFHSHQGQMPKNMKMSLKNSIKITDALEEGKFFPETRVQVHFDLLLDDDQFICE